MEIEEQSKDSEDVQLIIEELLCNRRFGGGGGGKGFLGSGGRSSNTADLEFEGLCGRGGGFEPIPFQVSKHGNQSLY